MADRHERLKQQFQIFAELFSAIATATRGTGQRVTAYHSKNYGCYHIDFRKEGEPTVTLDVEFSCPERWSSLPCYAVEVHYAGWRKFADTRRAVAKKKHKSGEKTHIETTFIQKILDGVEKGRRYRQARIERDIQEKKQQEERKRHEETITAELRALGDLLTIEDSGWITSNVKGASFIKIHTFGLSLSVDVKTTNQLGRLLSLLKEFNKENEENNSK